MDRNRFPGNAVSYVADDRRHGPTFWRNYRMKRNLSVTTAAAALLIGTTFAAAQGVQQRQGGGAEPGMQGGAQGGAQTAPSEGKGKAQTREPRTQGQGQREQGQREQGQRGTQGQREGQQQPKMKGKEQAQPKEPRTQGQREQGQREQQGQREGQTQQQPKQQPQQGQQTPRGDTQKTQKGAEGRTGTQTGDVKLTTEQRTKIRTTVLQGGNAPRVSNVDFSVTVGTVVPRERVRLVAVPPTLIEIHPAWRGYMYFIVGERIIIVEPSSYRIVAVLDV
jgi:hypothetical protein